MSASIPKTVAVFETSLAAQVVAGDTSITLTSVTDVDGVALASGLYAFTLDGDVAERREYIIGNLSGSTVSSIQSISAQNAATSGIQNYHSRGASVAITDWVAIGRLVGVASGVSGFDASAPLFYDAAPTGLNGNEIPTVDYVLSVVNGGTVTFSQQVLATQTAGENLTANDHVYFKESDQRWWKVDVDDSATYSSVKRGIALSTQTTGNTLSIAISGLVAGFSGLTPGAKYYGGSTAGAIVTGGTNAFIGVAFSATQLIVDPYIRDIPLGREKDALAGSNGIASTTNKYVTETNTGAGLVDQSQTTQDATQPVGTANTTGLNNRLAQSFTTNETKISGVALYKSADTGTFTGTVTVALQADSSGNPSGVNLASLTITNAQWLALPVGEFTATFSSEYSSLTQGSLYWIVISTSTADSANRPNIGTNSAGGYGSGSAKYNNTTDGWVAIATIDLYFKTFVGKASQIVTTGSDGVIDNKLFVSSRLVTSTLATTALTAAEAVLATINLPAGTLTSNSILRIKTLINVVTAANAGRTTTIRLRADSLTGTLLGTQVINNNSDSTEQGFYQVNMEMIQNASLSSQSTLSYPTLNEAGGTITQTAVSSLSTTTVDFSMNRNVVITGVINSVSNYSVDYRGFYAEVVK